MPLLWGWILVAHLKLQALSGWGLSNNGVEFMFDDGKTRVKDSWINAPQYPTLTPLRDKIVSLLFDGNL
jgi:hypothetical protein